MAVGADALTSLVALKAHLKITSSTDDTLLETLIDAATAIINEFCGYTLKSSSYTEQYDGKGTDTLILRARPLISVSSVYVDTARDFDSTSLLTEDEDWVADSASGFITLLANLATGGGGVCLFPVARRCIKVTYTAGYATIPNDLIYATNEVAAHLYNNRGSTRNVQSHSIGGFSETFGADSVTDIPANAMAILNRKYRNRWIDVTEVTTTDVTVVADAETDAGDILVFNFALGGAGNVSNVAPTPFLLPRAAVLSTARLKINSNTSNGVVVINIKKNGTTAITSSISAGSTADVTFSGTITFAAGDTLTIEQDSSASSSVAFNANFSCVLGD